MLAEPPIWSAVRVQLGLCMQRPNGSLWRVAAGEPVATSDAVGGWPVYRALPGGRRNPAVHPAADVDTYDGTAVVAGEEAA